MFRVQMFGSVLTNGESFFPASKFNLQPFKLFRSREDPSSSAKMGQTPSRPKAMSISGRTTQLVGRIRRASSQSTGPTIKGCSISMDSLTGSLPSTANSSRLPSIEYGESQSIIINQQLLQEKMSPSYPEPLTPHELNLIHTTWQNVISDSSNICLNFFQQMKKSKKAKGKWPKSGQSTPISQSPPSVNYQPTASGTKFLQAGSKHNDQIYYALRLTCCIDRLIFKLRVEDSSPIVTNRRSNTEYALDDNGELLDFLDLDNLSVSDVDRLVNVFVDTLKLVTVHSLKSPSVPTPCIRYDQALWSDAIQRAWIKLLHILVHELKES